MNRRRKRITVLVAVVTVLVCGAAAIAARHVVREWWLLNALQAEDEAELARVARELGELGSLKAVPILLPRLDLDEGAYALALTKICEKRGRQVIPALVQGLGRKGGCRAFCAERLAVFGPEAKEAIPALVKALGDELFWVRLAASQALGSMGAAARESAQSLLKLLHDEEPSVVSNAALALLRIDPDTKEALVVLVKCFVVEDGDSSKVVDSEVRGLLPYTGKLLDLLREEDPQLRRRVALVLGLLPAHEEVIVPALVKLLEDEKPLVVEAALTSLERLEERDAATVHKVTELLRRDDARSAAIRFLARSTATSAEALAAVQGGLREGSMSAQFLDQLAKAPPETLSRELIPQLLGFCRAGSDPERRLNAVDVLGNMGPGARSAVPALEAILEKEEDLEFESWAWNTLESIER